MAAGFITFASPTVLYAASAAAVPIIIHLVMRTKTRRVLLPTLRFVKLSYQSSRASQKLRHWLLLAMRIAAMLLLVALLAGMQITRDSGVKISAAAPTALAIIIDNSGSMACRQGDKTNLAWAKEVARRAVDDLPASSQAAVLVAGDGEEESKAGLLVDRVLMARMIEDVPQTYRYIRLSNQMKRALALLAESNLPRKAVLVLTDRTPAAWAGAAAEDYTLAPEAEIHVPDCWQSPPVDVAVGPVTISQPVCAVGTSVEVNTQISAEGYRGPMVVELRAEGKTVDQHGINLTGGVGSVPVKLRLCPQGAGLLHCSVNIAVADGLEVDNARYFNLTAEPPRTMLVVGSGGGDDSTAFIMSSAVAPAGQISGRLVQPVRITGKELAGRNLGDAALIMLAGSERLGQQQWEHLRQYVMQGGKLWLVPGDSVDVADYSCPPATAILPVEVRGLEDLREPSMLEAAGRGGPYLAPFTTGNNPPLSEVIVKRRVRAAISSGTAVLSFSDGAAAVAERRIGSGRVLWWAFSPDANWSNLATARLAQLPILARQAAQTLLFDRPEPMQYHPGDMVRLTLANEPVKAAMVRDPLGVEQAAQIDERAGAAIITPAHVGNWRADLVGKESHEVQEFTVNLDPAEMDLRRLSIEEISAQAGGRTILPDAKLNKPEVNKSGGEIRTRLDWPLGVLAALLLIGESFLANRFYKGQGKAV